MDLPHEICLILRCAWLTVIRTCLAMFKIQRDIGFLYQGEGGDTKNAKFTNKFFAFHHTVCAT